MKTEKDDTAEMALLLIQRHGGEVMPAIEEEISASTALGDWDQVKRWCCVRLRISRLLLARKRSDAAAWRSVYPDPAREVRLPWTADGAPRHGLDPSAA